MSFDISDKMDIEIAERLINYKIKMSNGWNQNQFKKKKRAKAKVIMRTNCPYQVKISKKI